MASKPQKYCPTTACKTAGKAARQRRWLARSENRDYCRGAQHVQRVREWWAAHPGYWRRDGPHAGTALRDALRMQDPVLIGLIAHLSGLLREPRKAS